MWRVSLEKPWLLVTFERPMQCLGWTPQQGGSTVSASVLWREVRNADLPEDLDARVWLLGETTRIGHRDSPCFMTSRRIETHEQTSCEIEGIRAHALATAGLGNAERIGRRYAQVETVGTINMLLAVDRPLTLPARLEALSLMAEARTLAMLEQAPRLWDLPPTGTGTDCLCLAAPCGDGGALPHAGKHTALGEAIGRAAHRAFSAAVSRWKPPS